MKKVVIALCTVFSISLFAEQEVQIQIKESMRHSNQQIASTTGEVGKKANEYSIEELIIIKALLDIQAINQDASRLERENAKEISEIISQTIEKKQRVENINSNDPLGSGDCTLTAIDSSLSLVHDLGFSLGTSLGAVEFWNYIYDVYYERYGEGFFRENARNNMAKRFQSMEAKASSTKAAFIDAIKYIELNDFNEIWSDLIDGLTGISQSGLANNIVDGAVQFKDDYLSGKVGRDILDYGAGLRDSSFKLYTLIVSDPKTAENCSNIGELMTKASAGAASLLVVGKVASKVNGVFKKKPSGKNSKKAEAPKKVEEPKMEKKVESKSDNSSKNPTDEV